MTRRPCVQDHQGEQEEMKALPGNKKTKEQENQGHKMTRGNTHTPSPPLAHSTKDIGNKKTKEQEDQGHKMTRGNKKNNNNPWSTFKPPAPR